jgi:ubiquitin carboxyl-terminal hydrolase 8
MIKEDNEYHGTQPRSATRQVSPGRRPPSEPQDYRPSSSASIQSAIPQRQSLSGLDGGMSIRAKPAVTPKPPNLHGTALPSDGKTQSHSGAPSPLDALSARFARLRPADAPQQAPMQLETGTIPNISNSRYDQPPTAGPRAPSHVSNGITTSSPIAINLSKDLPKPPSPTYSPARASMHSGASGHHSRYAKDGFGSGSPTGSVSSVASIHSSAAYPPYQSSPQAHRPAPSTRRKSLHMPQETEISASRLHDYFQMHNILLIDVRSREDYDAGHIFWRTGMCIEPEALRAGMSAEQLQEALIVSPDDEVSLFDQRDKFDLVVYHDQSTHSTGFLRDHANIPLKYLYDALYEFNHEKPLQYPPVLLTGGIDAWADLVGPGGLRTSNTAAIARGSAGKSARPISRKPLVTRDSRLKIQKRRHRDYNPLDAAEEESWRERARSESAALDQQPPAEFLEDGHLAEIEPYLQSYDDFSQRYPDVAAVERDMPAYRPQVPAYPAPPQSNYNHQPDYPHRAPPPPPPPGKLPPKLPLPPQVPAHPSRPPPIMQRPSYGGVNDRPVAQALVQKKQLPTYVSPTLKRLPRTGLHNFGATCYMNATLQSLSGTIPLTAFFLDGQYQRSLQMDNWKGSKGIMPEYFTILLRNLWQPNGVDTIKPTNFKKLCARLNKEWASDRQQDAKEFLEFLVDCLHEDLNVNWARTPLRQLTDAEEAERERTPPFIAAKLEWDRYLHRDHSRLTDLFAGQHISKLQCTTCGTSSTTYEAFYSISVEIPNPTQNRPQITLYDCLRSYCSAEMLSGDEVWHCPRCRRDREATKRITISRAPQFLTIHFKRFSASHSERARKIHVPVEFPLTNFDLEPFMLPGPTPSDVTAIASRYGKEQLEVPSSMKPPYRYDCYAVMRHLGGTMTSGHYISLVKDAARGCWREFNDANIGDFHPEDLRGASRLQNEQAYIVFYQRRDV